MKLRYQVIMTVLLTTLLYNLPVSAYEEKYLASTKMAASAKIVQAAFDRYLAEVNGKPINTYPLTQWGYNIGKLVIFPDDFVIPVGGVNNIDNNKLKVREYGNKQIYNTQFNALLISFEITPQETTDIFSMVRDQFDFPIVSSKTPPENYDNYLTIVELKSAVKSKASFLDVDYPVYKINACGKNPVGGNKRLLMYFSFEDDNQKMTVLPIGLFPGTRLIIPSDLSFTVEGKEKGRKVKYVISGGAIDVRLDKTIRLENAKKIHPH
jgi:hypothetical protein